MKLSWQILGPPGVMDRNPPTTTLSGDDYHTPPAGARARTEGDISPAPPSQVRLAQGGLATPAGKLSGQGMVRVGPASPPTLGAEAITPAKSPDPSAGQQVQQASRLILSIQAHSNRCYEYTSTDYTSTENTSTESTAEISCESTAECRVFL